MTNREMFTMHMSHEDDMRYIVKMAERMFVRKGVANAPIWEREDAYDAWLDEEFDPREYAMAKLYFPTIAAQQSAYSVESLPKKIRHGNPSFVFHGTVFARPVFSGLEEV